MRRPFTLRLDGTYTVCPAGSAARSENEPPGTADHATPPSAGSQSEMTSIYSLIDSVALNLDGAKSVVLLWNGSQLESFGGHLDTSRPLAPDLSLLAKSPGTAPASAAPPPDPAA